MFLSIIGRWVRGLRIVLRRWADPYRPELHYMRGPGPKWHQKHPEGHPG